MKRTQELFEKIDAYLNGDLKGNDLELFENTLKSDAKLQEEVDTYRLMQEALKDTDVITFRERLKTIDTEIEEEKFKKVTSKKSFSIYYKIAAVFIAIVGVSSFLWLFNPIENNLYEHYYVPYPMDELTRNSHTTLSELKDVSILYEKKKYQKAIPTLEKLVQKHSTDDKLKLYLGNSYLNVNQEEKAIVLFESILKNDTLRDDALWFLSLAYIKTENYNKATIFLKELVSYENLYKSSALNLLEELE